MPQLVDSLQAAQRRLALAVALLPRSPNETSELLELDLDVLMLVGSEINTVPHDPQQLALCKHVLNTLARGTKRKKSSVRSRSACTHVGPLPQGLVQRVRTELRDLTLRGENGIAVALHSDDNILTWDACIAGPPASPYAGGLFFLQVQIPTGYPMTPPMIRFDTRIYHCNIRSADGYIAVDVLGTSWSPALTVRTLLLSIQALLSDPNPEASCCAAIGLEQVGELCRTDRSKYDATARDWTHKFAQLYRTSRLCDGSTTPLAQYL